MSKLLDIVALVGLIAVGFIFAHFALGVVIGLMFQID